MEEILISDDASNNSHRVRKKLEWEIANVIQVATSRRMYKVPQILGDANKEDYKPKLISIGPYHYRSKSLLSMLSMKIRYLRSFFHRTGLKLGSFVEMAQGWEKEVRGYYNEEEQCDLNSDELVHMILLDGIFIVEFTHQFYAVRDDPTTSEGQLFWEDLSLKDDIMRDLMLLDNQLPFFVLKGLGDHSSPPGDGDGDGDGDDHDHEWRWMFYLFKVFVVHFDLIATSPDSNMFNLLMSTITFKACTPIPILHLVDFIHVIICTRDPFTQFERRLMREPVTFQGPKLQLSRSATELQQAGVKLGRGQDKLSTVTRIKFWGGVLLIPPLVVNKNTESLFRNIIAYEHCHRKGNLFRSYLILMDCLINTPKDVDLLIHSGIIHNYLGESEDVCTLFNNLYKMPMMDGRDFHFAELCQSLNKYSRDPWHKWKARCFRWKLIFRRDYISSPWSIFSVMAAIILLGLTIIQTICSIKGVVKW